MAVSHYILALYVVVDTFSVHIEMLCCFRLRSLLEPWHHLDAGKGKDLPRLSCLIRTQADRSSV